MTLCLYMILAAAWEKAAEERTEVPVCHSVCASLLNQTSLRAIFHPWGIPLMSAVAWLMAVIVQLHFDNSAFQGKQTTMFLFCNVCLLFTHLHSFLFTNGEVKWIKSVCRIERLYYVFLFLKGALEILVGSLQCKHYMQSHTWPLITSKGKETLSQEGVGEMCRVVLIHTSFTYTNGSCLRKEKEGKEVER